MYEEEPEAYVFPAITPVLSAFTGYGFVDAKGSARGNEYEYLHNSILLGGELKVFSFPHRLHLDLDLRNKNDYVGEASYAFKDIVSFREINRALFHNLDNITLKDLDPVTPSPGVDIRDAGKEYGLKAGLNSFLLRLKTPDFPSHFYIDGSLIERKGVQQQISLSGSGYFNDIVRKSRQRDIDWETRTVTVGVNSHLGPFELDISHGEKRFDAGGDKVLYEDYAAANSAAPRGAGRYPYSLVPELRGSTNTIKLHTSYTGGIVAAATLSQTDRENRDSGAKADYLIGNGEITWAPVAKLAFFLKYRHKETDSDNPDAVTLRDINDPANSYAYGVRPSISSKTDTASTAMRYRLLAAVTLRSEYTYETVRRENANQWAVPDSTQRHVFSLSADSRVLKNLSLKTQYTHREIHNPAYNTEPDRSDEGKISLSWIPLQRINTLLVYSLSEEKRDALLYVDRSGAVVTSPGKRDVQRDKVFGSVLFLLNDNLSLNTAYLYMRSRTQQDVAYRSNSANAFDTQVPYKEKAHNYSVDLSYIPWENVNINAGLSQTISSSRFFPGAGDLLEPVSIDSFSELKIKETTLLLSGGYKFKGGLQLGVAYNYRTIKNELDNSFNDWEDGISHALMLTISKRW